MKYELPQYRPEEARPGQGKCEECHFSCSTREVDRIVPFEIEVFDLIGYDCCVGTSKLPTSGFASFDIVPYSSTESKCSNSQIV